MCPCLVWQAIVLPLATLILNGLLIRNAVDAVPAPEPWYGVLIDRLPDLEGIGISGDVYAVNRSCIQIVNFTYRRETPDTYFWIDDDHHEKLTPGGTKLPTFEFGYRQLGVYDNARVVIALNEQRDIANFNAFGIFNTLHNREFSRIKIPPDLVLPKSQFLSQQLNGQHVQHRIISGPIEVLDRRTVKIYGFAFDATDVADRPTFFFVGHSLTGRPQQNSGRRVPVRGRDTPEKITGLNENYRKSDIILDLPANFDIYHIDFISVYMFDFALDMANVRVTNLSDTIPPYVPQQQLNVDTPKAIGQGWDSVWLVGHNRHTTFTFQLGPPGRTRGYYSAARSWPGTSGLVWYVNGFMTPEIWLKRHTNYTFVIEGGDDVNSDRFFNPLYIAEDTFGGFKSYSWKEQQNVRVSAGLDEFGKPLSTNVGRLCMWVPKAAYLESDPDMYETFEEYRRTLELRCQPGKSGTFVWKPDKSLPDIVYYQSYSHPNMGWKIMLVDEIPADFRQIVDDSGFVSLHRKVEGAVLPPEHALPADMGTLNKELADYLEQLKRFPVISPGSSNQSQTQQPAGVGTGAAGNTQLQNPVGAGQRIHLCSPALLLIFVTLLGGCIFVL